MFLSYFLENSNRDRSASSSEIRLYVRRKNIDDFPQDITVKIAQLEKIYLSAAIPELYIMCITHPRFHGNNQSRQHLAAVIVSQADEITVLEELETTSKLQQ